MGDFWTPIPGLTESEHDAKDAADHGSGAASDGQVLTADGAGGAAWEAGGSGSSPLTTKGDVWGFSTVDARIPVGSDGQVLTADSAQTLGVKWAAGGGGSGGALELIEEITVSSSVASITFSSIPSTYDDLILEMELETADAADQDRPLVRVGNGSVDTGSNYAYHAGFAGTSGGQNSSGNATQIAGPVALVGAGAVAGATGMSRMTFYRYTETDAWTTVEMWGFTAGGDYFLQDGGAIWKSTAVIDTIQVSAEGGNLTGGRARLYGRSRS